jgi:glyoxylate reductase
VARVLVTRPLPPGGLDPLSGHELLVPANDVSMEPDELAKAAADVDAIVCLLTDRIDATVLEAGSKLRAVGNVAVGFDNVDLARATERGVAVCNTPGVLDEATADLAFALVLAAARLLSDAEADLRAGRWPGWGISQYLGQDVHGATLGLVGYGRIASAVARRASGFDMRVIHHARRPTGVEGYVEDLDALVAEADVISLHVPLSVQTRHLVDARRLALMKPTAVLVNTSRGPVVDEEALAEALERRAIFAAGIDVYEREPLVHPRLLAAPHAVLAPHLGSATVSTRTTMARLAAGGVAEVLAGGRPANVVNPEVFG